MTQDGLGGLFLPGALINGRYEVLSIVDSGGFATVYKVFDRYEEQHWALKLFRQTAPDEALMREIACLRQIQHPNVLHVIWTDRTDDGRRFILSEFLEGETLERYARGPERLPDESVATLGDQLLNALSAIHPDSLRISELQAREALSQDELDELLNLKSVGFVHRDIKPANLMLTPSGLKIVDFNTASRVGDPVVTTSGTPSYMPPDADLTEWTAGVDLYAAGVTLYELLCQQHPYGRGLTNENPTDPRTLRPDLPSRVAQFLFKACAPRASERFSNAREMAEAWSEAAGAFVHPESATDEVARNGQNRLHDVHEGGCDVVEVLDDELDRLAECGAGWPAVFSCNSTGRVWATFGDRFNLQGSSELLDLCISVFLRERNDGGRLELSEEGVYVWSLGRRIVEFI